MIRLLNGYADFYNKNSYILSLREFSVCVLIVAARRVVNKMVGSRLVQCYSSREFARGYNMPTKRVELSPDHLKEARKAAAERSYSVSSPLFLADVGEAGLLLRVRGAKAEFIVKFAGKTRTLGILGPERGDLKPGEIRTIKDARDLARRTRALLKDGTDPKPFLTGKASGKSTADATDSAVRKAALEAGQWTWERLVDEYTDYLSKPRVSKGKLKPPSEASVRNAKASLSTPEADSLKGRLLSELRPGDLEEVRDACEKADRKTASRAFVTNARAALTFARKKHARKSGLEDAKKWWLEVEILDSTAIAPRTRMPSLKDIASTLYIAEKHRTLEGRKNARATSEIVLCGFWWLVLSGQRSGAGLALEKAHVLPWPDGPKGWKVALWSEAAMKSRRFHALPIPPRLVLLIERAMASGREGSKFVFPATATRKGEGDRALDKNSAKNLLARLRGKPVTLRREEKDIRNDLPDLLAEVPHFSPHDLRRAFATVCTDLAVRGDAVSAVLDHAGLETGQKMMRSAEVTRLAYDYSQRLELKRIAIQAWTDAVFEEVEKMWRDNRPKPMSPFRKVPPPSPTATSKVKKEATFSVNEPWYITMESAAKMKSPISLAGISSGSGDEHFE